MKATAGIASPDPGERVTGFLEVADLPTGGSERLPVIVARGERDGPTLWVTGGVHGNEMTGIAAVQDVLADGVPASLRGTVVCVPICNPAGVRRGRRLSYYHDDDPNRFFPSSDGDETEETETEQPVRRRVQELIDERLYEAIVDAADAVVDIHTAQVGSVPFVIRDRVLYGTRRDEDEASVLAERLDAFARASGLPLVNEFPAEEYVERDLTRSTAGALLNEAGIPAVTLELGGHETIDEAYRAAGVAAVYRAMVHLGNLESVPDGIETGAPRLESPVEFPVRRFVGPRASRAGLCRPRLEAGAAFEAGDVLADVVSPHGDVLETLQTPHDGYVLGWRSPVTYENDPVSSLAVRDEGELIARRG